MLTKFIHPAIVHFPIALIITGFLFASLSLFCKGKCQAAEQGTKPCVLKCAFWILSLGALSALAAILTGFVFTTAMEGVAGTMRATHAAFAMSATGVSLCAAVVYGVVLYTKRMANLQLVGYTLYAVAVVLIAITGHLGGKMVF